MIWHLTVKFTGNLMVFTGYGKFLSVMNLLNASVALLQKLVNWFAQQIN